MQSDRLIRLLRERSLKRAPEGQPFTLASGKKSMVYLDVRKTALSPEGHMLLGGMLFATAQKMSNDIEAVAGVALGGCPLASAVSMFSAFMANFGGPKPLPAIYVRKEAKGYGSQNLVEGGTDESLKVVLLEDVVTTGSSSLQAVQALHTAGHLIRGVIAVVDREEGGTEAFAKAGIPFRSLTTMKEILG